jgi:colanic acid biosynthesis glycosyl transferase WcaI
MPDSTIDERGPAPNRRFPRVLLLTQYYAPESGAAAIRLQAMVRELHRLGFEVRVVTGMPNYPGGRIYTGFEKRLWMKDRIDGVPVTRVWLYPAAGKGAIKRLVNYLTFTATGAVALLFEPRADLLFVEAQPITLAVPALMNRVIRGTPYVYNTPDLQVEYADEDQWLGIRLLIGVARTLEGFLMKQALSVTTVTHAFMDHFHRERGLPRERLTFLPNGADINLLRPLPPDAALAARLGLADRKVFTFAGTFAPYQGLQVIIDAATRLRHRRDLVFLMVGDGPVRRELMEEAARRQLTNVVFEPTVPMATMPALMSITWAALVVLRKLQIATKMRLAKAVPPLACGVPLVFAGWGETAAMVERERVGLVVEPENAEALAGAIESIADDPEARQAMSVRARALAERDFSWPMIVERWVEQIERLPRR